MYFQINRIKQSFFIIILKILKMNELTEYVTRPETIFEEDCHIPTGKLLGFLTDETMHLHRNITIKSRR